MSRGRPLQLPIQLVVYTLGSIHSHYLTTLALILDQLDHPFGYQVWGDEISTGGNAAIYNLCKDLCVCVR